MRVVHLNTTDSGGAALVAARVHRGLQERGVESQMLVARTGSAKSGAEEVFGPIFRHIWNTVWPRLHSFPSRLYPRRKPGLFSPALPSYTGIHHNEAVRSADVVCLYWVAGFLTPAEIGRIGKPILWTLCDAWPFTGGCHFPGDCQRFTGSCGMCPLLGSSRPDDLSYKGWRRKEIHWRSANLIAVAPSRWIADCAARSSLFSGRRIEIIPHSVDTRIFTPLARAECRHMFGIPESKRVVLYGAANGASDSRKGLTELLGALRHPLLCDRAADLHFLAFGIDKPLNLSLPISSTLLGAIADDRKLAALYSAADILVIPSREDNLPQVGLEGLACGLPIVAFDVGGLPDIIGDGEAGCIVPRGDILAMAQTISDLAFSDEHRNVLAHNARRRAERIFALPIQAAKYESLIMDVYRGLHMPGR